MSDLRERLEALPSYAWGPYAIDAMAEVERLEDEYRTLEADYHRANGECSRYRKEVERLRAALREMDWRLAAGLPITRGSIRRALQTGEFRPAPNTPVSGNGGE